MVSDVLDNTRQASRRHAELLLAGKVGRLDKSVGQLACQIKRDDTCSHHEKIHAIVLNPLAGRVHVMAQSRTYARVLIGHHRSPDRPGADQHTAFDTGRVEGRRKLIRYALIVASAKVGGANIFGRVPLSGKPGFQALLTFESDLVRTKPYPHDHSSRQIRQPVVQHVCQFTSARTNGKSLKVKEDEENASDTLFKRPLARDGLDVSVKASP